MQGADVVWGSGHSAYRTPLDLFRRLDQEFDFDIDLAADQDNHLLPQWLGPGSQLWLGTDALSVDWYDYGNVGFLNPPYSRKEKLSCEPWVERALRFASGPFTTVALLPVRTDTHWWNQYVMQADEIRTIPHRVTFDVSPAFLVEHNRLRVAAGKRPLAKMSGAGFPSAVVIWRRRVGMICRGGPVLTTWDYRAL